MSRVVLAALVDDGGLGRFQRRVLALCGLAALLGMAPSVLGPVFAAGTLGITIGAFALGPLAERIGRRLLAGLLCGPPSYYTGAIMKLGGEHGPCKRLRCSGTRAAANRLLPDTWLRSPVCRSM